MAGADENTNARIRTEVVNLTSLKEGDVVQDWEGDFGVVIKGGYDGVKVQYPDKRVSEKSHLYRADEKDIVDYIHQREEELAYAKELLEYESARERLRHINNG